MLVEEPGSEGAVVIIMVQNADGRALVNDRGLVVFASGGLRNTGNRGVEVVIRSNLVLKPAGRADCEEARIRGEGIVRVVAAIGRAFGEEVALVVCAFELLDELFHAVGVVLAIAIAIDVIDVEEKLPFAGDGVDSGISIAILLGEGDEEVVIGVVAEDGFGVGPIVLEDFVIFIKVVVVGHDGGAELIEELVPGEAIDVIFGEGFPAIDGGIYAREVEPDQDALVVEHGFGGFGEGEGVGAFDGVFLAFGEVGGDVIFEIVFGPAVVLVSDIVIELSDNAIIHERADCVRI